LPLRAAGGDFNDDLRALGYQSVKVAFREQIALEGRGRLDYQSADTSASMPCGMPQSDVVARVLTSRLLTHILSHIGSPDGGRFAHGP
jgi:hypothetical protein